MDSYILFFDDMNMLTVEEWIKQIHNMLSHRYVMLWICFTSVKKNKMCDKSWFYYYKMWYISVNIEK